MCAVMIPHKDALQAFYFRQFLWEYQQNIDVNGKIAENISMTVILGGLGYEHYFTDHLLFYGYGTYIL
jgi:hypothetical protein